MSCESWECYSEHGFPQKQPLYFAVGCFRLTDLQSMVEHEALMASPPDPRALELVREELARVKAEDGNPDYDMKRTRGPCNYAMQKKLGERWPEMLGDDSSEYCHSLKPVIEHAMHALRPPSIYDLLAPTWLKLLAHTLLGPEHVHYTEQPLHYHGYNDAPIWWGCEPCPRGSWRRHAYFDRGLRWGPRGYELSDAFHWSKERECHITHWMMKLPEEIEKATNPDIDDYDDDDTRYFREVRLDLSHHRPVAFGEYLDLALTPYQLCYFANNYNGRCSELKGLKIASRCYSKPLCRKEGYLHPVGRSYDHIIGNDWWPTMGPDDHYGPYISNKEAARRGPVYRYGLK